MLFSAAKDISKWMVFGAASAALIVARAVGILVGSFLPAYIDEKVLSYITG
ncbi:MAG: putative Ca2+/H+ antiporter (TMEM165/GDT1 family) [Psychroserpens sp.]|jgi:putative Ca2+/H+ antiporter (TMEM165/GDT1 family)